MAVLVEPEAAPLGGSRRGAAEESKDQHGEDEPAHPDILRRRNKSSGSSRRPFGRSESWTRREPPYICDTSSMEDPVEWTFDAHMEDIRGAPADDGRLELIVRRPATDEREVVGEARLDPELGLVGDRWGAQDARSTPVFLGAQLTLMGTRTLAAIEPDRARWPLAGDQLYVDLDLSTDNLPPGTRLAIGSAIIDVSETPHTGCSKFSARFGGDTQRWVNSEFGRANRLRGLNARIVEAGTVRVGDRIRKV